MLFGSIFEEGVSSLKNSEENDLDRMRKEIRQNIREAQDCIGQSNDPSPSTSFQCDEQGCLITPEYDEVTDYYKQFWKLFLLNEISLSEIRHLNVETQTLKQKVSTIEVSLQLNKKLSGTYFNAVKLRNKKKHRRPAIEIQKSYSCPYENCYKNYGSDVSLNLHIKIKHNGGNKTDREKYAQQICLAEIGRGPKPTVDLCFPPGFLENFRADFMKKLNGLK